MVEIFKDIPEYEGIYQISNLSNVKSLKRIINGSNGRIYKIKENIRKQSIDSTGYLCLTLSKNGDKIFRIHQLMAITFMNHIPKIDKLVVDHINNNPLDNRLENLQLISQRENSSKDKKNGTSKYIGVCFIKKEKKWGSFITIKGKSKNLGSYINEYDAHLAYQKELSKII